VTNIADGAFVSCYKLTAVYFQGINAPSVGPSTFYEDYQAVYYILGLEYTSYNGAVNLAGHVGPVTAIIVPDTFLGLPVTSIGGTAFLDCSSLTSVMIGTNVTSIGYDAFEGCGALLNVTIPDSVTSIVQGAFYNCSGLTSVTIGNGVTSIGDSVFANCNSLTNVTIPNSVTSIGQEVFYECSRLSSITIGTNVASIGDEAFYFCIGLSSVTIPSSVTSIGQEVFYECYNLKTITVVAGNPVYNSLNGVLFGQNQTMLVQYPPGIGRTSYTVPNTVTSIGNDAFFNCNVTSVTVPSSVTSLGENALSFCFYLTAAYFQGNAPGGDSSVFSDDPATAYYLPGNTGWGSTFCGIPTAPWTLPYPLALTGNSSFGIQNNQFSFTISWATNLVVVVEACTNFANPVWQPVATNTLTGGTSYFSDSQWTNYPGRYYRLRSP
jgi:hypothetical protein